MAPPAKPDGVDVGTVAGGDIGGTGGAISGSGGIDETGNGFVASGA